MIPSLSLSFFFFFSTARPVLRWEIVLQNKCVRLRNGVYFAVAAQFGKRLSDLLTGNMDKTEEFHLLQMTSIRNIVQRYNYGHFHERARESLLYWRKRVNSKVAINSRNYVIDTGATHASLRSWRKGHGETGATWQRSRPSFRDNQRSIFNRLHNYGLKDCCESFFSFFKFIF